VIETFTAGCALGLALFWMLRYGQLMALPMVELAAGFSSLIAYRLAHNLDREALG
jgi:hypothetical protein